MQNLMGDFDSGSRMFENTGRKMWESYLNGVEKSLELTRSMSDVFITSIDRAKETQKQMTDMSSEAVKNFAKYQMNLQGSYNDLLKQGMRMFGSQNEDQHDHHEH
ncbi:MAG: hypothetical protein ACM3UZ_01595 [Acidobacteriota bacterium]